jgi:HSP20 family protein
MQLFTYPFGNLAALQQELDKLLQSTGGSNFFGVSGAGVFPPINVFRDRDEFVIRAELPGVAPDKIDVSLEHRRLTLQGERTPEQAGRGAYHRRERAFGRFSRTLTLPEDLDVEKAVAQWRNGVLTLKIPPVAAAKPRHITVQAA